MGVVKKKMPNLWRPSCWFFRGQAAGSSYPAVSRYGVRVEEMASEGGCSKQTGGKGLFQILSLAC